MTRPAVTTSNMGRRSEEEAEVEEVEEEVVVDVDACLTSP
jgi:hypothetical protein